MRIRALWLPLAAFALLGLIGTTLADGDGGRDSNVADKGGKGDFKAGKGDFKAGKGGKGDFKGGKGGGPGGRGGRGLSVDDIVDRIMSFDKNKDGKITKDELPERMQSLIARGDTNKDGVLDRDEVRKLAGDLARDRDFGAFGGFGGGFAGPDGPGRGGPSARFGPGDGQRGTAGLQRAVDDLRLNDKTKDKAETILKAHQDNVRKLLDLAKADLLLKMKEVLSEQEFKNFKDALERQPAPLAVSTTRPAETPRGNDIDRKLDEIRKSFRKRLDDLRRELRR